MNKADIYLNDDIDNILENGYLDINPRPKYADGTPAHTKSVNHTVRKYDLSKGEFPICSKRRMAWKTAIREIFTIYLRPTNNIEEMKAEGVNWWDEWDIGDGSIGRRYGYTVKSKNLFKKYVVDDIKKDPYGRRHVLSLWQEDDLAGSPGLAPCAFCTIWNVRNNGKTGDEYEEFLDMMLIQRSGDMMVASGAGHSNEIQYAALLMMVANSLGYKPGIFTHVTANEQIYDRHLDNARIMRERPCGEKQPMLKINREVGCDITSYTIDDFEMVDYEPNPNQLKFDLGI